jgi:hypothetical protein
MIDKNPGGFAVCKRVTITTRVRLIEAVTWC